MIFSQLYDAALRGELLLVDGGMCHYHLRRDGQLTIREIISTRRGSGKRMLAKLKMTPGATSIFAKCPSNLKSNQWYARNGFILEGQETTLRGGGLNHWRLRLDS